VTKLSYVNLILSVSLCTLIWIIQILHYPSFKFYSETTFNEAMSFHQRRISYITLPLMLTELMVVLAMVINRPETHNFLLLGIVLLIWISTFLFQVPIHNKLLFNKNNSLITRLVMTNWLRTILWSIKLLIVILIMEKK